MMKTLILVVLVSLSLIGFSQKKEKLFNGKNLDGWSIYVADQKISPEKFFYVTDGVIETPGVPMGYLRTKKEFENYRLHVEWRYPEKPTNSGVFIHTVGPDKIWPRHYQCQLKHLSAGDFIIQDEGLSATVRDTVYVSTAKVKPIAPKLKPSSENKPGEWNSYDIVCKGNTVEVKVNGVLQNYATNCSETKGGIGLQAEGSKIQFRNIRIEKIK
jgi:hypothetical protein